MKNNIPRTDTALLSLYSLRTISFRLVFTFYLYGKAVNTIAIRLRYDYDPTTTYHARLRLLPFDARKNEHVNFSS